MREIKFRAWDKEDREWLDGSGAWQISDLQDDQDYIWTQYTGLKDKSGKDIYEGDILKGSYEYYLVPSEMNFNCGECYWVYGWEMPSDDGFEVIGNIYENPELLQEAAA